MGLQRKTLYSLIVLVSISMVGIELFGYRGRRTASSRERGQATVQRTAQLNPFTLHVEPVSSRSRSRSEATRGGRSRDSQAVRVTTVGAEQMRMPRRRPRRSPYKRPRRGRF